MPKEELSGTTALVTGASRGFGRAITLALAEHGAEVVGVARDRARLEELHAQLGDAFTPVSAGATDPVVAGQLRDRYRLRTLVLNAGAAPLTRPVHRQTWETFSRNWDVDVRHVFNWTREALLLPLQPGSVVIAVSSGAAVNGSPLSGGYAGAKATIRFIASYAAASPAGTPTCSPPPAPARCSDAFITPSGGGVLPVPKSIPSLDHGAAVAVDGGVTDQTTRERERPCAN